MKKAFLLGLALLFCLIKSSRLESEPVTYSNLDYVERTDVGINHIGDKDADIARRLNEKINRNRGKKTSDFQTMIHILT